MSRSIIDSIRLLRRDRQSDGGVAELRDREVALLVVEEKARNVIDVADTIVLMELGRIRWIGPRADADADRLAAAYLGA